MSVWDPERSCSETRKQKSAGVRCHIPAAAQTVNTWPGLNTPCAFPDPPWTAFLFEDSGGRPVLYANVFMPQLPADVPMQRKVGPQEGCCRRTGQNCFGGHLLLNPESCRFFSPALQKSSSHLPVWHDLDTMSESSLWTLLSNFNMPHFLSGARLRRSQR